MAGQTDFTFRLNNKQIGERERKEKKNKEPPLYTAWDHQILGLLSVFHLSDMR